MSISRAVRKLTSVDAVAATNGKQRAPSGMGTEKRAPTLAVVLGTWMNFVLRYLMQRADGSLPGFLASSIDTTGQRDHPHIPPLHPG